jgi:colanic acid/amylovoran biosynthesis protein
LKTIEKKYPQSRIVMLPQTFNYGTYDGDDIHFFEDLQQYTQDGRIVIIPDKYSSDIQQKVISKAQCMVGARYHSVVFSLNQAVPFVALSYEHKISGLLETLGKTDCMVDITHGLDSPEAIDRTVQEFERVLAYAHADKSARLIAKEIARGCFEKFMKAVRGEVIQNWALTK